jgi:hypothetical protein
VTVAREIFPHLGLPAALPQASNSLESVANWPARLPRGERNGTRAAACSVTARVFTREEQAQNHVQAGNIALSVRVILSWLDSIGRRDSQAGLTSWTWSTGK